MSETRKLFHQVNYSKFSPPKQHPLYLARKRLLERLDSVDNHKYTLLQAPEGYGKSSLLSDWYHRANKGALGETNRRAIWFRVDSNDRDSLCFWGNLVEILDECWPGVKDAAINNMDVLELSSPFELLLTLANFIVQNSDEQLKYTLIFDNFEVFKLSESESQFFRFADMLPSNVNIVIASKEFLTNKLEQDAYSKFTMFGVQDFALTKKEIGILLSDNGMNDVSESQLDRIYCRTEGWPLALYILLEQIQSGDSVEAAIKELTGTNRYLSNVVFKRVTQELPQKVMMFLLETSFFERFTTQLCHYVFDKEAGTIITHLDRAGTFIFAIDSERQWYRYHCLFAEWLKNQAMSLHRDQIRTINHKAAFWYRSNNETLLSAKHLVAASEGGFVSGLTRLTFTKSNQNESKVMTWLFNLQEKDLQQEPFFCLLASWAYVFSGRPREAKEWLMLAYAHVNMGRTNSSGERIGYRSEIESTPADDLLEKRMSLTIKVIEAKCLTLEGRAQTGIDQTKAILNLSNYLVDDAIKMVLYQNLGEAYELLGLIDNAMKHYQKAMTIAQVNDYEFLVGFTRYQIILLVYAQGRFSEAEKLCRTALVSCPPDFTIYGALYSVLGLVELMQTKFEELDTFLKRAFGRVSADRNIDIYLDTCVARSQYLAIMHDYSEALLQMAVARQAILSNEAIPPRGTAPLVYAEQTRLFIRIKDYDSAEETMNEYLTLKYSDTAVGAILWRTLKCSIAIEKNEGNEKTLSELEDLAQIASQGKYILHHVEILLLITRLHYYLGKHNEAVRTIKKAIDLSKREQIVQLFLNEGEVVRLLLTELVGSKGLNYESERFARKLVIAFDTTAAVHEKSKSKPSWLNEASDNDKMPFADHWSLTNREGEVLQLLVRGMNRKEIAADLCTSQNTIKTHISHIYEKMGVHSVPELLRKMMDDEVL